MDRIATIYDVAERARVSITTVSRFLNNPDKVAVKTRKKIEEAMRELQFTPKADAVARARKGTKRIGILTPFLTAQSFVERLEGIHKAISPYGYELITYLVDSQRQLEGYLSMLPVSGKIDGLIILALPFGPEDAKRFEEQRISLVSVEVGQEGVSSIRIDDRKGGALAAKYLISRGYKRLAFMGGGGQPPYSLHATELRLEGYAKKLDQLGYPLQEDYVCFHEYGMAPAIEAAVRLLSDPYRPDAIFCASDFQAVSVIKAARQLDIAIPQSLGVLGFDDTQIADHMEISTIRQSLLQSGQLAARLLIERLNDPGCEPKTVELSLDIVERMTT